PCQRTSSSSNPRPRRAPSSAIWGRITASSRPTATSATCRRPRARESSGSTSTTTSSPTTSSTTTGASRSTRSKRPPRPPTSSSSPPTSTGRSRRFSCVSPPPARGGGGARIPWHVAEAAHVPADKTRRVTFSEITESAIHEAFAHPRDIDRNLVDAQQTRRIVDRLSAYTLSPLLSRKVRGGLSAGRVQSVAVRLVVEREREIDAFVAREYWTLRALLATRAGDEFEAELVRIDGKPLDVGDGESGEPHA